MGEGVNDEARKALEAIEKTLAGAQLVTDYFAAKGKIERENPDGLVREMALASLDVHFQLQVEMLTRPRLNLPGGKVAGIEWVKA